MIFRIHKLELDDAAIIRAIEFARERSPSNQLGVSHGGWSSPKTLQAAKPVADLLDRLTRFVIPEFEKRGPIWEAWGNINPPDSYTGPHTHKSTARGQLNKVSAVYFPADHPARLAFPAVGLTVEPRRGLAVLFPPDAEHLVDTNWVDRPRYSIAMNAY